MYVFDLSNFEGGAFTATRLPKLAMRPPGGWVCIAGSDEQAFALAMRAAFGEWAMPHRRLPEQFTVRFIEGQVILTDPNRDVSPAGNAGALGAGARERATNEPVVE